MDSCEAAQMVFARVKSLEPSQVNRIMGYLLLQDHSNTEMFNLAFSTDVELKEAVAKAKKELLAGVGDQQRKNIPSPTPTHKNNPSPTLKNNPPPPPKTSRSASPEEVSNPCKFFARGHCKLGTSCQYVHSTTYRQKPASGNGNGNGGEKEEACDINARQLYLTFAADSRFTEEDVLLYFSSYGAVEDVRIPSQPKRMFGFVTFQHAETAKAILLENNPHFIGGARILVKPYRDRPISERTKQPENGSSEDDNVGNLMGSDAIRRLEEDKKNRDLERKLAELHLANSRAKAEAALQEASSHMEQTRLLSSFLRPDGNVTHGSLKEFYRHNSLPPFPVPQGTPKFPSDMGPLSGFPLGYVSPSNVDEKAFYSGPPNTKSLDPRLNFNLNSAGSNLPPENLMCCICFENSLDPIQFDCGHMFCAQCLSRAPQTFEDECLVCSRNTGSKVHKMQTSWFTSPTDQPMHPIW